MGSFADCYYADPACFIDKDKNTCIFAEYMKISRGIGSIAVAKVENGTLGAFTECIKEDFHISYPNVFDADGEFYRTIQDCDGEYGKRMYVYRVEKIKDRGC